MVGLLETGLGVRGVVVPQTAVQEVDRKVAQGPAVEAPGEEHLVAMAVAVRMETEVRSSPEVAEAAGHPRQTTCLLSSCSR